MSEEINNSEDARKKINSLLSEVGNLVGEAEELADKYGLEFSVNIGGYGMGGWYTGDEDERGEYNDTGWMASSQSC